MPSLDWSSCNWENITFHDRNLPRSIQYFNKSSIFVNESMPDLRLITDGLISLVYYICRGSLCSEDYSSYWQRPMSAFRSPNCTMLWEKGWSASDFVGQAHCSLLKLYDVYSFHIESKTSLSGGYLTSLRQPFFIRTAIREHFRIRNSQRVKKTY